MAVRSLSLFFLQTVAAAPALVGRSGATGTSCPTSDKTVVNLGGKSFTIECGIDTLQGDMSAPNGKRYKTFDKCIQSCVDRDGCQAVAYMGRACYLKGSIPKRIEKAGVWGAVLDRPGSSPAAPAASPVQAASSIVAVSPVLVASSAPAAASSVVPVYVGGLAKAVAPKASASCARPAAKTLSTKRGVPYNDVDAVAPFAGKISWAYNWGSSPDGTLPSGVQYIPMMWSPSNGGTTWNAAATSAIASGSDTLLGFNEPDLGAQANLSVDAAVKGWNSLMEPFKCKARLAAPAVTNGGAPMGLTYLKSFLAACSGCTIDVVPIHWYDSPTNVAYFKQYIADAYAAGGNRPLWITEFGFTTGTDAQIASFFKTVSSVLALFPRTYI